MNIRAGAATRDISPTAPVQLAGYPHAARRSTGIHDPLLASALFLQDDASAVVLAALDLLMLNGDVARRFRRRVAQALGLADERVLISCTHTHSGPVTLRYLPWQGDPAMPDPDPAYLERVEAALVEAAVQAQQQAKPAELGWTSAQARGVGGNRHVPDGRTDPETGVLGVRASGRWLALAVVYGMHPTVLHEDSTLISGDFPAFTRRHLQEALGSDVTVLYHTGPAGDQSPRHCVQGQTFAEAERLGRSLGAAVAASLGAMVFSSRAQLAGAIARVELPRRNLPTVDQAEALLAAARERHQSLLAGGAARADVRTAEVAVFGAEGALRLARAQQQGELDRFLSAVKPFEVQVLRIGEACLMGFPGEIFAEYGLQLKARAPMKSFPIAYANGELQGYVVTPEAALGGGYEAAGSLFEPEAGKCLVEAALECLGQVLGHTPTSP